MKRILIFSLNYYPRFIGGAEVAIKEITDRIPADEIEFHVVTLRFDAKLPKVEQIGKTLVHRIGFVANNPGIADLKKFPLHLNKYYFQLAAYFKARELHKKYRYDGTWAMMAHSCAIPAGLFKWSFPNTKYLLTLQEGDPPEAIERMMRPVFGLFRRGFTSADALQTISTFLLRWGERMGFRGKSVVIPNGVDTVCFTKAYTAEELTAYKVKLAKKESDIYLVTTSRLVHKNAIDDVIRALPLLPANISFIIFGIGPDEDALRKLASDLGVAERARFMGQIGHEEMPLALKACNIFIRASRSEGMGNSFIEAMAAELPAIATQEGGISDFLFDAKRNPDTPATGWAVDKDAPEQIAEAVKDIVGNPDQTQRTVANAKQLALGAYGWDRIAGDMRKLFKELFEATVK